MGGIAGIRYVYICMYIYVCRYYIGITKIWYVYVTFGLEGYGIWPRFDGSFVLKEPGLQDSNCICADVCGRKIGIREGYAELVVNESSLP